MLSIVVDAMLIRFKFKLYLVVRMANNHVITHLLQDDDDDESAGKKKILGNQLPRRDFIFAIRRKFTRHEIPI